MVANNADLVEILLFVAYHLVLHCLLMLTAWRRVATVREKVLENEKISRSGKSQGITFTVREN